MVINRVDKHAILSQSLGIPYHDMVDTFINIDNSQVYIYWKNDTWFTAHDVCNSVLYGYDTLEELVKAKVQEDRHLIVDKDRLGYRAVNYGKHTAMIYFQHYLTEVAYTLFRLKHNQPY